MRCGDCSNKVSCDITSSSISDAGIRTGPCWRFPSILDHGLGDIVAVAPTFLRRMRRRESIAVLIIEQAHQQTLFGGSRSFPWRLEIGLELQLALGPTAFDR